MLPDQILTYEAADYLASLQIKLVGMDYLTIERPRRKRTAEKGIHKSILSSNILICEGLNLRNICPNQYFFFYLPIYIKGLDGSPVRCVLQTMMKGGVSESDFS